jgi:hypothetical protein
VRNGQNQSSDVIDLEFNSALHKSCTQLYSRKGKRQEFLSYADIFPKNAGKMLIEPTDQPAQIHL